MQREHFVTSSRARSTNGFHHLNLMRYIHTALSAVFTLDFYCIDTPRSEASLLSGGMKTALRKISS